MSLPGRIEAKISRTETCWLWTAGQDGHGYGVCWFEGQSGDADRGEATTVITWNLAGYQPHHAAHGKRNRLHVAGYSDAVLQTLPSVIALGSTGRWPWESAS